MQFEKGGHGLLREANQSEGDQLLAESMVENSLSIPPKFK